MTIGQRLDRFLDWLRWPRARRAASQPPPAPRVEAPAPRTRVETSAPRVETVAPRVEASAPRVEAGFAPRTVPAAHLRRPEPYPPGGVSYPERREYQQAATRAFEMRGVRSCWACCSLLALSLAAIAGFIIWTIAATNPLWKAQDTSSAAFMLPSCQLKPLYTLINPSAAFLHGECVGTLRTILFSSEIADRQSGSPLCARVPAGTSISQLQDVLARYASEHPDQANSDFRRFVFTALHDSWPCK